MNNLILSFLNQKKSFMVCRLGATEAKAILYPNFPKFLKSITKKIIFNRMFTWSGFFPVSEKSITKFSNLYRKELLNTDILVSWRIEEKLIHEASSISNKIKLKELEPYYSANPWTKFLENKKVLIIHPFIDTILSQYNFREKIFENKDILPKFDIETVKAVQSLSGEDRRFKDWFYALDFMKDEISNKKFDIALIGCGAYGLPLAGHVKRLGKIGIHMGGCLQLLFGIKGKRWDNNPSVNKFYNDNWVRPSNNDMPKNYLKVENGCYW